MIFLFYLSSEPMKAVFIIKLCIYFYSLHHLIYYSFIIIIQIKITNNRNLESLYKLFLSSWVIFLISKWTYPFFVRHGWRTILFPGAERRSNISLTCNSARAIIACSHLAGFVTLLLFTKPAKWLFLLPSARLARRLPSSQAACQRSWQVETFVRFLIPGSQANIKIRTYSGFIPVFNFNFKFPLLIFPVMARKVGDLPTGELPLSEGIRKSNIRLTGNPRLARFVPGAKRRQHKPWQAGLSGWSSC